MVEGWDTRKGKSEVKIDHEVISNLGQTIGHILLSIWRVENVKAHVKRESFVYKCKMRAILRCMKHDLSVSDQL